MASRPLIKESLSLLSVCGLNPIKQSKWTKLRALVVSLMYFYIGYELLLKIFVIRNQSSLVDGFTAIGVLIQILSKVTTVLLYRKLLTKLIFSVENFSNWDDCNLRLRLKLEKVYAVSMNSLKTFGGGCVFTAMAYFSKPFIRNVRELPFDTYHPTDLSDSLGYYSMYLYQAFGVFTAAFTLFGCDGLFISLVMHVICELKIIKNDLTRLKFNEKGCSEEIFRLVNRHSFVLKCIKEIDKTYSILLLIQFFCSIISVCFGLLTLTIDSEGMMPSMNSILKYVTYVCSVLLQLFIYCFIGMYLTTESESVSDAVYKSEWYTSTQPSLQKACLMIIQRSQKQEYLTAGGMFNLDLENFTNIVRAAFSFYTLMQAVYSRDAD